ncbi:MAG: hypothetical protein ACYC65_05310 [Candidatus Limnocylindrales bacterium]
MAVPRARERVGRSRWADRCTRVIAGTATTNVSTKYTYDAAGNLASMIDGNGHATAYGHDVQGRMTSLADASGGVLAWAYDDAAHTKTQTNRTDTTPATLTITSTYDKAGRVTSRAYLDDAGPARTTTYTFAYTSTGSVATAVDGGSTVTTAMDRLGRPTTVTVASDTPATTTYGYSFTAPTRTDASGAYTMAVNPFGAVTSLTDPVHASPFTWAYGAQGATSFALPGIRTLGSTWQAVPNRDTMTVDGVPLGPDLQRCQPPDHRGLRLRCRRTDDRPPRILGRRARVGQPGPAREGPAHPRRHDRRRVHV